jgi:hypothetical protein
VGDLRRAVHLEAMDHFLQFAISMGHPFMLPQMLDPRIQHERFDEPTCLCEVFEETPVESAVSTPFARKPGNGTQKHGAIFRPDLVFNRHQNRSSVSLDVAARRHAGHQRANAF